MKVAVLGCSSPNAACIGRELRAKDAEIVCAWDYTHSDADKYCREFGGKAVSDIEQIADAGLDGVLILTKPQDHVTHALPFIAGGVPAFIDEPVVTGSDDLSRIVEAVREHGTPIMTPAGLRCQTHGLMASGNAECAALVETFLWMCEVFEPPIGIEDLAEHIRASLGL